MHEDDKELQEAMNQLVIARLRSTPPNHGIVIGGDGHDSYSPTELIAQIEQGTDLGQEYVEFEIDFLRSLRTGLLYE